MRQLVTFVGVLVLATALQPVAAHGRTGSLGRPQPAGPPPPNVVVILLDDLGIESLESLYDLRNTDPEDLIPMPQTPALDSLVKPQSSGGRFAEGGIVFEACYVNPLCSSTRAALLTGRHGIENGVGRAINSQTAGADFLLEQAHLTVAELLEADPGGADYARGYFGKWHLVGTAGWLFEADGSSNCDPMDRGFEVFMGQPRNNQGRDPALEGSKTKNHFRWRKAFAGTAPAPACNADPYVGANCPDTSMVILGRPRAGSPQPLTALDAWSASMNFDDAACWIEAEVMAARPFFAYIAPNPPHEPYHVPPIRLLPPDRQTRLRSLGYKNGMSEERAETLGLIAPKTEIFRASIEALDAEVGVLLDHLAALSVLDQTMIIVIGDNGSFRSVIPEYMNDRTTTTPLRQGKRGVYELGVRVPLIVAGPLVAGATATPAPAEGWRTQSLVSMVDLWRTVAQIAGLSDAQISGVLAGASAPPASESLSFKGLIEDPESLGQRQFAYCERFERNGRTSPLPCDGSSLAGCGEFAMRRTVVGTFSSDWDPNWTFGTTDQYKLVWSFDDEGNVLEELFHLRNDGQALDWLEETDLFALTSPCTPVPLDAETFAYCKLRDEMLRLHADSCVSVCDD